jgi:predicted dehydrogenase
MVRTLRAGVIGAGVFGRYHAEKFAALAGVELAGVYDHRSVHAQALAETSGAQVFPSEAALIEAVDLVSIATPATAHAASAMAVLAANKPVYIEKPLAALPEDAAGIVEIAERNGLVAACGFLERAGAAAVGLFDIPERPRWLEAVRRGPPSPRNLDVSVVLDLMIHDLDLALALAETEPVMVEAGGAAIANATADESDAEVEFEDGFIARFVASRVAEGRERSLRVVYPSGEVRVDFLTHMIENTTPFPVHPRLAASPAFQDRLKASLAAFVAAVRGETRAPMATVRDGARALDLALAVEQAMVQQGLV